MMIHHLDQFLYNKMITKNNDKFNNIMKNI